MYAGGHFARQPVGRFFQVVRRLHGQAATGCQVADEARVKLLVVGQPLQRGIGQDHVLRLVGLPGGDVGQAEGRARQPLACGIQHVLGIVQSRHGGPGEALGQDLGGVAGAAAQVHGQPHGAARQIGNGGHQVAHGAGAFLLERCVLLCGPGHRVAFQVGVLVGRERKSVHS